MSDDGDTNTARSEPATDLFQVFVRLGTGEKVLVVGPVSVEAAKCFLNGLLKVGQPGETFWIERVQEGDVEVGTGYRAREPRSPLRAIEAVSQLSDWEETKREIENLRVCAGRRRPTAAKQLRSAGNRGIAGLRSTIAWWIVFFLVSIAAWVGLIIGISNILGL